MRPLTKWTSRDRRSSFATMTGHLCRRASANASPSRGRRSRASEPLPVSTSTCSPMMAMPSRSANAAIRSRDWINNLSLIHSDARWPFDDSSVHIVVTNQVIEHVANHSHFFSELQRIQTGRGFSAHLFPPIHNLWEPHLRVPIVHWIRQHNLRRNIIVLFSKFGMGLFRGKHDLNYTNLYQYADEHSDYI